MIIPEYQRQKLQSSVVGTPGMDTSGQRIGSAVAGAFSDVSQITGNIAVQRQEAKDAALANRTMIEMDMKLSELSANHEKEYAAFRGDKLERERAFQTKADDLFKSVAEAVPSRGARDLVERNGYSTVKGYLNREREVADRNQVALAYTDTIEASNLLAQRAGQVALSMEDGHGKQLQLSALLKQGERTWAAAQGVLSPEQSAKLKAAIPEQIGTAFLVSSMRLHPEQVSDMLNVGAFDNILTAEKKAALLDDARAALPKVQAAREIDTILTGIATHQDMWDRYISKDPTLLGDLEGSNDEFAHELRDLVVKGSVDPINQAATVMRLAAKFEGITKRKHSGDEKKQDFGKKATLEDLKSIMKDVVQSRSRGEIDEAVANTYLKKLAEPMYDKIEQEHRRPVDPLSAGAATGLAGPIFMGLATITDYFRRSKLTPDQKAAIVTKYLRDFDSSRVRTQEEANAGARQAIVEQARVDTPGLGLFAGVVNRILNTDGTQTMLRSGESDAKGAKVPPKNAGPREYKTGDSQIDPTSGDAFYKWSDGKWRARKES